MKTLLLDLDRTLSHMDLNIFLKTYLFALVRGFTRHMQPGAFMKQVMASTGVMVKDNRPDLTNKEKG